MPTVQLKAELSADDLLQAVGQLDPTELHQFVLRVLALRARRQAPSLPCSESELFQQINEGLPQPVWERSKGLIEKRRQQTLTGEEHEELIRLTDQVEKQEAKRAEALVALAQLRHVSLTQLLTELGIRPPADD